MLTLRCLTSDGIEGERRWLCHRVLSQNCNCCSSKCSPQLAGSCEAQAGTHGCSALPGKLPYCFWPALSASTFVSASNEQDQMNYNHSERLCWTVTAAQYPSQFSFALSSQLPEFHNGVIKTHFTVNLGKETAKKLFSLVILNASVQSPLRSSKKQRMGE